MAKPWEEERRKGQPRTDAERVAAHYGITIEEAERWLQIHSAEELLPPRGYGLTSGTATGEINVSGIIIGGVFGAVVGGFLGAIAVSALVSERCLTA